MCHMKPDLLDTHPLLPSSSNTHIANSKTCRPLLNVQIYDDLEAKQETRFFKRGSCLVLKKFHFRNHYNEAHASSHKTCNSGVNGPNQYYKNPKWIQQKSLCKTLSEINLYFVSCLKNKQTKKESWELLYANNPIKYLFPFLPHFFFPFKNSLFWGALEYFSSTPKTQYDLTCKYFSYPSSWTTLRFKQTGKWSSLWMPS